MDQEKIKKMEDLVSQGAERMRADLRAFDKARYSFMMAQWAKISDSPQKAGYTAVVIAVLFFLLGWLAG